MTLSIQKAYHHAFRFQAFLQGAGRVDRKRKRIKGIIERVFFRWQGNRPPSDSLSCCSNLRRAGQRGAPSPLEGARKPSLDPPQGRAKLGEAHARRQDQRKNENEDSAGRRLRFFSRSLTSSLLSLLSLSQPKTTNSTMPSCASCSTRTTRPSSSTRTTSARGSSWTSAG